MVATRTARRAAHNRSLPFLALWRRDDVTDSVVDFLPTPTIAVLPIVAKPLRAAQQRVLLTAVRRRGKTLPSPRTTRMLLETLIVGEPRYFREDWKGGLAQWSPDVYAPAQSASYTVRRSHVGASYLEITKDGNSVNGHGGLLRDIHGNFGKYLIVNRLRVTMSYVTCEPASAVGYVLVIGSGAPVGGPRFNREIDESTSLVWFPYESNADRIVIVEEATPHTTYTIDAVFHHERGTCHGSADISVNGQQVARGAKCHPYRPLSKVSVYNYGMGTSVIEEIEVWSEVAAPNQVWAYFE